jgi:flagellar biosynthesis/type III secretory pathway ATPase
VLSRALAAAGQYPAIDVLESVSRLASKLAAEDERQAAQQIREALAAYRRSEDLIHLGAYAAGSNRQLDAVIQLRPKLLEFLRQPPEEKSPLEETLARMRELAGALAR